MGYINLSTKDQKKLIIRKMNTKYYKISPKFLKKNPQEHILENNYKYG